MLNRRGLRLHTKVTYARAVCNGGIKIAQISNLSFAREPAAGREGSYIDMATDFGALVSDAIGKAVERLRFYLNNDYGKYEAALRALDVAEAQLRALPLDDRPRLSRCGDDPAVLAAGAEWMWRLDHATNDLEDLVQDMEAAAARARWWLCAAPDAVARWLSSHADNMVRMELTVGRLAGTCVEGGEIFDVHDADAAALDGKDDSASESDAMLRGKTDRESLPTDASSLVTNMTVPAHGHQRKGLKVLRGI